MICLSSAGSLRWPQVGCFCCNCTTSPGRKGRRGERRKGARDDVCRHSVSQRAPERARGSGKHACRRLPVLCTRSPTHRPLLSAHLLPAPCSGHHSPADTHPLLLPAPPHPSPPSRGGCSCVSLNQHRTRSNAVRASSAVHLRPKTLPGENLGGPGPPAPPETTDGAGAPRTGHGQRTFSFDCLHFPTLSQRCPEPEQRRQTGGCPPAHPPPPRAPGVRRSRIRWFTRSCVSHDVSQLAALFIDA